MADPIIIGTTTGAIIGNEKARNIVSGLFCCVPSMNDSLEVEVLYPA
jgi:hypothetical protein